MLKLVHPLIAGLDSTKDILAQADGIAPEQLSVITHLRAMVDEMARGLRSFQKIYPSISLQMYDESPDEIERSVLNGSSDVAVVLEPGPDKKLSPSLLFEPIGEIDFLLVTSRQHPLSRVQRLQLKQIIQHPLVLSGEASTRSHAIVLTRFCIERAYGIP